jgi:uncharacterized Fe-S center protein
VDSNLRLKKVVYYGSMESAEAKPEYSLIAKLNEIISNLGILEVVKEKKVVVKVHVGSGLGFNNIHPFITGYIVRKIKNAGGVPFIVDILDNVKSAYLRGYTSEVLDCPIYPVAGLKDEYMVPKEVNYKGVKELFMGGFVKDAEVLVDLSHVKGHNNAGFGGALKNLGIGCYTQKTRWRSKNSMHSTVQYPQYWYKEKSGDAEKLIEACPYNLIKFQHGELTVDHGNCNQCMRCMKADTDGCLRINRENFASFFEIMVMAAKFVLENFEPENKFFINFAMDMTTHCDCWGFTNGNILPDLGILGSKDVLAIDKATLDLTKNLPLIRDNVPKNLDINDDENLHPFARIHGPFKDPYLQIFYGKKHGLGETEYKLEEVKPSTSIRKMIKPEFPKALELF